MKKILTSIIAVLVVAISSQAQTVTKTELMNRLESDPAVSVAFVTSNMLKHLPKDSSLGLSSIASHGKITGIRVYSFIGSTVGESNAKALMDVYVKESNFSELLMKIKSGAKETIMWGIPETSGQSYYDQVLLMSRGDGSKSSLIIMTGKISTNIVGELIESVQ